MHIIAHRGASGVYPENTLPAFIKAAESGAWGVECDIHLCATGEPFIIHDDTVQRTTLSQGKVSELTCAEIQALSVKGGGHIPPLTELFDTLGRDMHYFLEIKAPDAAPIVAETVIRYVKRGWDPSRFMLISFHHQALLGLLPKFAGLRIGITLQRWNTKAITYAVNAGAVAVLPYYKMLNPERVEQLRALRMQIYSWTANSSQAIARLKRLGVDGAMTDYPERFIHET